MSKKNIWVSALERRIDSSAEHAKGIVNEICEELKQATDGKVGAQFKAVKLKTLYTDESAPIETVARQALARGTQVTIDENAPNLEDASSFYDSQRYGFDIFNDNYSYRPFEASIGALYPIKLFIDETIARESRSELSAWLDSDNGFEIAFINGDDDLRECIRVIASSRKMTVILQRLVNEP